LAVPTVTSSSYLSTIGELLLPSVGIFWNGPDIVSETIPVEGIIELSKVIRRRPTLWDNYYSNPSGYSSFSELVQRLD
jgi:hypothetical protein